METNCFFSRDSEAAFGRPGEARLDQQTNGNKLLFFLGIQKQRLAAKVRPGEARFGLESDGEKLWCGARCSELGWAQERKENGLF